MVLTLLKRWHNVIKPESPAVTGKDRAHRKSKYKFTVEGYSGEMEYRIGDDDNAEWKTIIPDVDGEYIIPKGEIINKVFIEKRQ
jgi:hypothetical protein